MKRGLLVNNLWSQIRCFIQSMPNMCANDAQLSSLTSHGAIELIAKKELKIDLDKKRQCQSIASIDAVKHSSCSKEHDSWLNGSHTHTHTTCILLNTFAIDRSAYEPTGHWFNEHRFRLTVIDDVCVHCARWHSVQLICFAFTIYTFVYQCYVKLMREYRNFCRNSTEIESVRRWKTKWIRSDQFGQAMGFSFHQPIDMTDRTRHAWIVRDSLSFAFVVRFQAFAGFFSCVALKFIWRRLNQNELSVGDKICSWSWQAINRCELASPPNRISI